MAVNKGQQMVNLAEKKINTRGAEAKAYCGLPSGANYCDAFVTWLFKECGIKSLYCNGTKQVYCPTSIKICYDTMASIPIYLAMPGDVIFFDWEPNGNPNHVGMVRARDTDQTIFTVEGNTSTTIKGRYYTGMVANKTRTLYGKSNGKKVQYIQAVFRPQYEPKFNGKKELEIDGQFGFNSIAMLQKALDIKQDGILGLQTVKTLQKLCGVTQDGSWGKATSKAVQRTLCGFKGDAVDGEFGEKSVKALQKWINKTNADEEKRKAEQKKKEKTVPQKAVAWGKKIAKDNSWVYVTRHSKKDETWECPICHKHKEGKTHGWNCIGFVGACYHHGANLTKMSCDNDGILSTKFANKMLKSTTKQAAKQFASRNGYQWTVIKNNYKAIPQSELKAGDIIIGYNKTGKNANYQHVMLYVGSGKIADATSSKGISVRNYSSIGVKPLLAVRYVAK